MDTKDDELEQVLERLRGVDLYRGNAFRITGLPVDATPARIRRSREEAVLRDKLSAAAEGTRRPRGERSARDGVPAAAGAATGSPSMGAPGAAPGPREVGVPGSDVVRAAHETLRDPVARLVHELLWEWGPQDQPRQAFAEHDAAVRLHREVVEAEFAGHTGPIAIVGRLEQLWTRSLDAWAAVLTSHAFWDHAKRRVAEIGDPRLTTGTVRRLRDRLPQHVLAVTAELAVRAARTDPGAVDDFAAKGPPRAGKRSVSGKPPGGRNSSVAGKPSVTGRPLAAGKPPKGAGPQRGGSPEGATASRRAADLTSAADRFVAALRNSPFSSEVVAVTLRDAVRPAERDVRAACTTAREALAAKEGAGGAAGRELLKRIAEPQWVVRALLSPEAELTTALSEEVAVVLNQCAVAQVMSDDTARSARTALDLLVRANRLARIGRTRDLIARNMDFAAHRAGGAPTGPSPELPDFLRQMCERGKVERVAGYLRALAAKADRSLSRELRQMAVDGRSVAAPIRGEPFIGSVLGCGVRPLWSGSPTKGTWWMTYAVTVLYLPVLPLARYAMDRRGIHARVPLTSFVRWWRRLICTALPIAAVALVAGGGAAVPLTAALIGGQLAVRVLLRRARIRHWARSEAAR